MIVAFASSDGVRIDQHFGWSKQFHLFEVGLEHAAPERIVDSSAEPEGEHEKLTYKIGTIEGSDLMYCTQIGPTAAKMVQSAHIHPVKVAEGELIDEAIARLQQMLRDAPPPWLARIYHKSQQRSA
ncbi:MAG: dinitrogenase iron-molybdenum cofactor biosynthesis protein [Campylobacterales bacterium]|nr:dinitrogenase iron-molybdenum cofactor biosynthesis protein [Campylobacterales bacterium]